MSEKPWINHCKKWKEHCKKYSIDDKTQKEWMDRITKSYSEPHRGYHTLAHISRLLTLFDQSKHIIKNPDVVYLAILFHDIIYDPKSKDNEIKSIKVFKEFASRYSLEMISSVCDMIECTISHQCPSGDPDTLLFLDFDLEILSANFEEYKEYANGIRKEYCFVEDYNEQRIRVLDRFLQRKIYFTSEFQAREACALQNIQWEIKSLRECSIDC